VRISGMIAFQAPVCGPALLSSHVYSADGTPGRTPTGTPAIGDHALRTLAKRSSLVQGWISGLQVGPNTARKIIADVSQVFAAALDDGIIIRNPLKARSVQKPRAVKIEAVPWTAAEIEAVSEELPARLAALPYLGSACGLRQGELFAAAVSGLDFLRKVMHVEAQVKYLAGRLFFAPVKNGKPRDVPVADPVIPLLAEHVRQYPPVRVTLPVGHAGRQAGHPRAAVHHRERPSVEQERLQSDLAPSVEGRGRQPGARAAERMPRAQAHRGIGVVVGRTQPRQGRRLPRRHQGGHPGHLRAIYAGRRRPCATL
jgi:integrase